MPCTLSMSLTTAPDEVRQVRRLMATSAERMYLAKRSGGNLIVTADGKY